MMMLNTVQSFGFKTRGAYKYKVYASILCTLHDFSFLHIDPTAVVTQYFAAFLPARYDGVIKYDAWQYFKQADSK